MRRGAVLFLGGLCLASPAQAEDGARRRAMLDNGQADLSVCIAYYSLIAECAGNDPAARKSARVAIADLAQKSERVAQALAMKPDETAMRLEFNLVIQRDFIQNSCKAIARLSTRYADQCGELRAGAGMQ